MCSCLKMKKKENNETPYLKNGRMLLEELIASCDGKSNPIRIYSAEELTRATNNYHNHQKILRDADYVMYSGILQGHPVTVKKYNLRGFGLRGSPITDIVIGSQMSVHKNVLKLIGCCLETEDPVIVYEFVGNQTLSKYIYDANGMHRQLLPWKCRVKIVAGIANAVSYLHTALSRPIIHRDIRTSNIILSQDHEARLMDFSLSISIPDGQSHVEDTVVGRSCFLDPEYLASGRVTENVDVFNFGFVLFEVLSGQRTEDFVRVRQLVSYLDYLKQHVVPDAIMDIIDNVIANEGIEQEQLLAFATLALNCICSAAEDRPTMIEVARELKRIHQLDPLQTPCLAQLHL